MSQAKILKSTLKIISSEYNSFEEIKLDSEFYKKVNFIVLFNLC